MSFACQVAVFHCLRVVNLRGGTDRVCAQCSSGTETWGRVVLPIYTVYSHRTALQDIV